MRLGLGITTGSEGPSLDEVIWPMRTAAEAGFGTAYFTQLLPWDLIDLAAPGAPGRPSIDVGRR